MGDSRFSAADWTTYSTTVASVPRDRIFTSSSMVDSLNPAKFDIRESVDSPSNPNSTPIILFSDVTGSMGSLAETIIKHGLGVIMTNIYDAKPVTDPHILCGAIGDVECDSAPCQATQFEADVTAITQQLSQIYIEQGGGSNRGESYTIAWLFAALKTKCDAISKRNREGYLFTIGDECPLPRITKEQAKRFLNLDLQADMTNEQILAMLTPHWEVFHLIVKPVSSQPVVKAWRDLLGQNAILVDDDKKLAEVVVATIRVVEGHDKAEVTGSWDGTTAMTVGKAIRDLKARSDGDAVVAL